MRLCVQKPLTLIHDLLFIDVTVVILASLPPVKGQVMKAAKLIVESGSSGTKHILKFARVANVTKVIFTGSFSNVLHPDDSWNPIVVTEDGKCRTTYLRSYQPLRPRLEFSDHTRL